MLHVHIHGLGKVHEGGNAGMTSPPPFANQLLLPPPFSFGGGGKSTTREKRGRGGETRGWREGKAEKGLRKIYLNFFLVCMALFGRHGRNAFYIQC